MCNILTNLLTYSRSNNNEELKTLINIENGRNENTSNLEKKYEILLLDNDPECFYVISFVDKEIFFTLNTLNNLLGEKNNEYVNKCYFY
jgi:hypothetical protein